MLVKLGVSYATVSMVTVIGKLILEMNEYYRQIGIIIIILLSNTFNVSSNPVSRGEIINNCNN